jgi:hypothetical protein
MSSREELLKLYPSLNPSLFEGDAQQQHKEDSFSYHHHHQASSLDKGRDGDSKYKALVASMGIPAASPAMDAGPARTAPGPATALKDLSSLVAFPPPSSSSSSFSPSSFSHSHGGGFATSVRASNPKTLPLVDVVSVCSSSSNSSSSPLAQKAKDAEGKRDCNAEPPPPLCFSFSFSARLEATLTPDTYVDNESSSGNSSSSSSTALRLALAGVNERAQHVVVEFDGSEEGGGGVVSCVAYLLPSCRCVCFRVAHRRHEADAARTTVYVTRIQGPALDFQRVCAAFEASVRVLERGRATHTHMISPTEEEGVDEQLESAQLPRSTAPPPPSNVRLSRTALASLFTLIGSPYADTAEEGVKALAGVLDGGVHRAANLSLLLKPSCGVLKLLLKCIASDSREVCFFGSKCLRALCGFMQQRDAPTAQQQQQQQQQKGESAEFKQVQPCLPIEASALTAMLSAMKRHAAFTSTMQAPTARLAQSARSLCSGHTLSQLAWSFHHRAMHPQYADALVSFAHTRRDFRVDLEGLSLACAREARGSHAESLGAAMAEVICLACLE